MGHDEHELMIEYAEMTSFNFNSKEYQEVKKDFIECKDIANSLDWFVKNLTTKFRKIENV